MANQSPDRRQIIEMLAKAAVASQFPGFSKWVFAGQHEHVGTAPVEPRPARYEPQFFKPEEYRTIDIVSELIIPRDESPGAHDAGVSEFIDFMAAHGEEELHRPMREGLAWLHQTARTTFGQPFAHVTSDQQAALLRKVAYRNEGLQPDLQGQSFFQLIRRYTVMGYYTSRAGLEQLDFPGLRLYTQSPECPHKDDPEHRHLPAPRF